MVVGIGVLLVKFVQEFADVVPLLLKAAATPWMLAAIDTAVAFGIVILAKLTALSAVGRPAGIRRTIGLQKTAHVGLFVETLCLNSTGVSCPRLECGCTSL